jgi:Rieske Fe-S protein
MTFSVNVNTFDASSRSVFHPQLAINAFESALGLLTPTTPRCPHLGCALKYYKAEHTWDCPCHGSRFTEHGELIERRMLFNQFNK